MFIRLNTLNKAGLKVSLDKNGLCIQGTAEIPESVRHAVEHVADEMGFKPIEHDELLTYVADVGVWNALKGCETEV